MSKIDLEQLRIELKNLNTRQQLFKVLREELSKLGWWKARKRGNPSKGYKAMRERKEQ
jgi:hypothetical protein